METRRAVDCGSTRNQGICEQVRELRPWFHNLHLPDGTQTASDHFLGDYPRYKWMEIQGLLPVRMDGWSVLDIGCNAGFYSFELARRGAKVTAVDSNGHYLRQARWAGGLYGLNKRVSFHQMQIYDLAMLNERFDLVVFMGVFYHLRYPLLGLDIAAQRTGRLMLFQTLSLPGEEIAQQIEDLSIADRSPMLQEGWPKMAFIEHSLAGDRTNWWAANHAGIEAMLRSSGLRVVERPGQEVYLCEPDQEHPSFVSTWGTEEFLSATGKRRLQERVDADQGAGSGRNRGDTG
jgi:tRNA (mo5U34)-methyltransferase